VVVVMGTVPTASKPPECLLIPVGSIRNCRNRNRFRVGQVHQVDYLSRHLSIVSDWFSLQFALRDYACTESFLQVPAPYGLVDRCW
jgi:hypothetical protein